MNKKTDEDELKELRAFVAQKKVEDSVNSKMHSICRFATANFLLACYWLGDKIYSHSNAVIAAIKAFWAADHGSQ